MGEESVFLKNTAQCPRPGLDPGPLASESGPQITALLTDEIIRDYVVKLHSPSFISILSIVYILQLGKSFHCEATRLLLRCHTERESSSSLKAFS